jgi:hypothetical protein
METLAVIISTILMCGLLAAAFILGRNVGKGCLGGNNDVKRRRDNWDGVEKAMQYDSGFIVAQPNGTVNARNSQEQEDLKNFLEFRLTKKGIPFTKAPKGKKVIKKWKNFGDSYGFTGDKKDYFMKRRHYVRYLLNVSERNGLRTMNVDKFNSPGLKNVWGLGENGYSEHGWPAYANSPWAAFHGEPSRATRWARAKQQAAGVNSLDSAAKEKV